ncbi:probable HAK-1 potassium transporter [Rhynchosporium graminicola]|uniref:Probable HAK-1 potassium transporter n=1 Tax=Rhynchosporium graminicola TaxID=2792576 RepID=A0A1E1KXP0_9HELO|nr:probable HAK-1 potassium transporter [Rhynchosporium commune]
MSTVRISDGIHPIRSDDGTSTALAGGVYPIRNSSVVDLRATRTRSAERRGVRLDAAEKDDEGLRQEGDFKKKQTFKGKYLLWLAYQSIGVIYGDIGTSPLYVYSSTFASEPSHQDLVGVLSIIIWSLTMMVTFKYVLIILHADNEGEGGTFSTYSLLSRFANITKRDPREASLIKMERYLTGDIEGANLRVRNRIEKSKYARAALKVIGVLAVSMVMADGVLTPAQSVLGAVQGLGVVKPDIEKSTIVGTTCGILVLLFLIQPFGTAKLASAFAPIVIVWLGFNAGFGIYNLVQFDHSVLKAFSPGYAFDFLVRRKHEGWRMLGGTLLAFTGVEALFADLGAFSRHAIQLSWLTYAFPCLLMGYIGQAAYISENGGAYKNPFFNAAPPGMLYPGLIIAILAAVVASQAMITATFQLIAQVMKLSYFPQIKVVHTSKIFHGQVYIPLINWLLMIGTVMAAAIYNNTTSLGNAYGVCVMFVTFFDTCMVSLAALIVWRLPYYVVFFPWLVFACLDATYLSSALVKVPDGAWFTLLLSGIITCFLILWRFGKESQWAAESEGRFPTTHLVENGSDGSVKLTQLHGGDDLSSIKGFGIFFDKGGEYTPAVFTQFLSKLVAAPEIMVFFHLRPLETPTIAPEDRYTVTRVAIPNCYRLVVRHGYMDEVITPDLASLVCEQVRKFIICQGDSLRSRPSTSQVHKAQEVVFTTLPRDDEKRHAVKSLATEETIAADLAKLQHAFDRQVLYIIGKQQMRVKTGTGWWRRAMLHAFLWLRDNTRTKIANLRVQPDRVVEVGFVKEV